MRVPFAIAAALGLAACTSEVPDSGAGFSDYNTYIRQQEAPNPAAAGAAAPMTSGGFSPDAAAAAIDRAEGVGASMSAIAAPGATIPSTVPMGAPSGADLAAAGVVATAPVVADPGMTTQDQLPPLDNSARPRGNAPAGIQEESGEMVHNNVGISDEQDFNAVSQRESIESDAARIARNRAEYVVVEPVAVPERPNDTGPNIVQFAISTTNNVGEQVYERSSIRLSGSACNRYSSPDQAQEAFLAAGGPDKDRKGLDPDGDGFACSWDPRPFRAALQ